MDNGDSIAPSYRDNVQISYGQVDNSDSTAPSYRDNVQITNRQVDNSGAEPEPPHLTMLNINGSKSYHVEQYEH